MGIWRESTKHSTERGMPSEKTTTIDCRISLRAYSNCLAPTARAIMVVKPTPSAMITELIRLIGLWLMETEAVALAPSAPTMAVSTD